VASYLVEGGPSRDYLETKRLMYGDPGAWRALLSLLARTTARYLNGQIAAGARAVQLFDSWVGTLGPDDYRAFALPYTRAIVESLTPGVPVIHFGTGTGGFLEVFREAGGDVIGLDWRVDLGQAWDRIGPAVAVQGNLDPAALLAPPGEIRRRAAAILAQADGRPGHVFNLGHGVLPATPVDHVRALVDAVHELSQR
jgi:uroporphyrinogen decarboxylase